jgi:hypothetical protein
MHFSLIECALLLTESGSGGHVASAREGGALLGYNRYHHDSEETSSESEQEEQLTTDLTDASIASFVSNGERVWRAPEKVFSKRRQSDEKKRSSSDDAPASPEKGVAEAKRWSQGSGGDAGSRRNSGGPDVPRLNFGGMFGRQSQTSTPRHEKEHSAHGKTHRGSRPPTPSIDGSPVMSPPQEPVLSSSLSSIRDLARPPSMAPGDSLPSPRSIANNQQVV